LLGKGLALTAFISFVSVLLGSAIATLLLFGLTMPWPALKKALVAWCTLFRGTPMIAQLYFVYYGARDIQGSLSQIHL
jgi:His/Glu/Gln/Arg/opine family amino acid ABC transporter permease subunit